MGTKICKKRGRVLVVVRLNLSRTCPVKNFFSPSMASGLKFESPEGEKIYCCRYTETGEFRTFCPEDV